MQYNPRRRYTEAFRVEAVRRSVETPGTLRALAAELGIAEGVLQRWRRQYLSPQDRSIDILTKTQPPEKSVKELERENRRLKKALKRSQEDVEILKKAQEYFAAQRKKGTDS